VAAELRVLVLTPDFPPMSGGIQHLLRRVLEQSTRLSIRVIAPAADGAAAVDSELPFEVRRVGAVRSRQASLAAINAAAPREARRFRPDVVLSGHIITSPGARLAARICRAQLVQYFYADEMGGRPRLARSALHAATLSIAISTFTRGLIAALDASTARIEVVTPGVDLPQRVDRSDAGAQQPTVLTVARMDERYKGHDVLARAFPLVRSRVPDARWVVIGDGRLAPAWQALVRSTGCQDAVWFTGSIRDAARDDWMRRSHVFAMPSRLPARRPGGEGFGIVFLEAGAHGLPVVAGAVGGALDAVRDGETGLLVDPTDHLGVADALVELLTDRERAARMGAAGRVFAEAHAWPLVAARVEDLLFEVAGVTSEQAS
jgi:phosphatidylinositol alpha-1,6-mannosyltransferase